MGPTELSVSRLRIGGVGDVGVGGHQSGASCWLLAGEAK